MGSVSTTLISEASSLLECCSSDVLFSSIVPAKLGCILPKVLNKVDFPMPFTPTMEASSPLKSVKLISLAIQFCCFLTVYPMLRFFVSRAICDGVFFILNRFLLLLRYWFLFAFAGFSLYKRPIRDCHGYGQNNGITQKIIFLFLISSHITTGAPIIEVMALIGSTLAEFGIWAMVSQTSIKMAP